MLFALYHLLNREDTFTKTSKVIIDVSKIKTSKELHLLLKVKLQFPNFYGENWDSFWETITSLVELPNKIEFIGWSELEKSLPEDSKIMKEYLIEHNQEFPSWKCEFLFN
ncbi:barstar family protein [Gottfriedia acidiceleris]|uniref:barstar family protein n=1 Tax=Bacillaceae TaxID=186817 RepID=UPI003000DACC